MIYPSCFRKKSAQENLDKIEEGIFQQSSSFDSHYDYFQGELIDEESWIISLLEEAYKSMICSKEREEVIIGIERISAIAQSRSTSYDFNSKSNVLLSAKKYWSEKKDENKIVALIDKLINLINEMT